MAADSMEAGARYAWVTLQSLNCMEGYLKAQFRCHHGINATFMQFLTPTTANQMAVSMKGMLDTLVKRVKKLKDEHAMAKGVQTLDAKLEVIIKANNLKRLAG